MSNDFDIRKIDDYRWEIPKSGGMRVPGRLYTNEKMLQVIKKDNTPVQVKNVAHLPGIIKYSLAMPDMHWGYGFCIGGVAATDPDAGGVISPGGIGYDINCLSGDTEVLHFHGYHLKIKDFEDIWQKEEISCFDFINNKPVQTPVSFFLKRKPSNKVYKIKTSTGKSIVATEDHPFYTKDGMKPLKDLKKTEQVAVNSFEGVPYKKPSNKVILTSEDIKRTLTELRKNSSHNGNATGQILKHLHQRGLLPLRYNSLQLPYLLKLMGYIFGDGCIHFVNQNKKGIIGFYGLPEDLEEIRKDIFALGFTCSKTYNRERDHKITTHYASYMFSTRETCCRVISSSLAVLLISLGTPYGRKAQKDYLVPEWIFSAPLWQKRLFLASFFGAELSSPKTLTRHGYNLYCPIVSLNKRESKEVSGRKFLSQIKDLLMEFGVKTHKITSREEKTTSEGKTIRLRLIISGKDKDLIKLYTKVGFEYNQKRKFLANVAVQFLKEKKNVLSEREEVASRALELKNTVHLGAKAILKTINSPHVNLRFIQRSMYGGRKGIPRIGFNFPIFSKFLKKSTEGLETSGMVWDKIVEKKQIDFNDYVYDFTVKHPHHNFIANSFVVSNCGVRLIRTNLQPKDVKPKLRQLLSSLFNSIPSGVGSTSKLKLSLPELKKVLKEGAKWAVARGYGEEEDLERCEDYGCMQGVDPEKVSMQAYKRGNNQLGTLGSGNHFLEVDVIEKVFDEHIANAFGLFAGQIVLIIHSGSRGLGYQVCDDYLAVMRRAVDKYHISLPDRQLSCAPITSKEGRDYFAAMAGAANYAWANRQVIMHWTREVCQRVLNLSPKELGMRLVYDVCHNIGKFEEHSFNGKEKTIFIHRKGATRAFPANHPQVPGVYKSVGQPVLIPGDMGTTSYVLVGVERAMEETWGSTCHGAGRVLSRSAAVRAARGRSIEKELEEKGILVIAKGRGTIAEEMSEAYKDVDMVVDIVEKAGLARKVVKMVPLGVIKG
ncbi:intein-containing RctB family protein [Candidatus Aerophobetes bacterium]|nr:intein-containing RctB family protein [Candidatus Aerophobetes bacterium]